MAGAQQQQKQACGASLRREEEEEQKGFAFLNLNITYGLSSIFNRGRKPFLATVQFHPRPNITVVAFLKY